MTRPALTRSDWLDLAAAAPRLIAVWAALPVLGIARTRRWTAGGRRPGRAAEPLDPERWRRRALALRRLGARLPGCRCLARSIALGWWLHRHGQAHRLFIGVAGGHATLRSHSWIEAQGHVLDDTAENVRQFKQITEI